MSSSRLQHRALLFAPVLALAASAVAIPAASADTAGQYAATGSAYGTSASLGSLIKSSPTAAVGLCSTDAASKSNDAQATSLRTAGTAGVVKTQVSSQSSGSTRRAVTTARTGSINLLGGLIRADAVTATATSQHSSSGYSQSASSRIANLTIAGAPVAATPGKNTSVSLPDGLGTVVLNAQSTSTVNGNHTISENAIVVTLNSSKALGLPSGTIVVGHASSTISAPIHRQAYGAAWATKVTGVNGQVLAGTTAPAGISCGGTGGATVHNTVAAATVGKSVGSGTASSTARSTDSATATTATTGTKLSDINLLSGVVRISALNVGATATRSASAGSPTTSATTSVVGLKINGKPVTVSVRPNTKIDIAGVGTLWLRRTSHTATGIGVYGVQLKLLTDQSGLKAGSTISLGYASAGVYDS